MAPLEQYSKHVSMVATKQNRCTSQKFQGDAGRKPRWEFKE